MIRQLANLSHCTSPASANFDLYTKILEDLAEVKIGIVLVELMRSLDPSGTLSQREMMDSDDEMDENDESALREEATEMLCELIDPLTAFGRRAHHGNAETSVRIETLLDLDALVGVESVDLVHTQDRLDPTAFERDENAIDPARPKRRRLDGVHEHRGVQVRGDHTLAVGVARIGTRQDRPPQRDTSHDE